MILLSVTTIISSVFVFLFVIITLVGLLLFVKAKLSPSGKIKIKINGEKEIEVDGGGTLLSTLSNEGIFLPSACGGGGTCVQCTCQVHSGGGGIYLQKSLTLVEKKLLKTGAWLSSKGKGRYGG